MKKFILPLGVVALTLVSCKKDYTCSCTNTRIETVNGESTSETSTNKTTFKDVKKSFVEEKAECYSTEDSYSYTNFLGDQVNVKRTNDCSIEK